MALRLRMPLAIAPTHQVGVIPRVASPLALAVKSILSSRISRSFSTLPSAVCSSPLVAAPFHLLTMRITGVWAGDVWADDSKCSGLAATCEDYVRDNPSAFEDAYWTINSLKVYTNGDGSSSSGSTGGSGSGSGETGGNSVSAGSAPASTAAPNPGPVNSAAPNPGPVNSAPANSAAPVNTGGVSVPATTAAQPVGNPAPTGAPGGGWPGRGGGGRPGRGGPPKKIKRRVRGRHMKHLIVEASDQRYDEQGQSVILEAGVPELGEELQRV